MLLCYDDAILKCGLNCDMIYTSSGNDLEIEFSHFPAESFAKGFY
jgi:hypothetical protein